MNKKALGKGLGAFIPDEFSILKDERFAELNLEDVKPNPFQPRTRFDDQTIDELAQSIKETGIVQPVIVVPQADDHLGLRAGGFAQTGHPLFSAFRHPEIPGHQ